MNKKAQIFETARKTIFWMIMGVVITGVMLGFTVSIANYKNNVVKVPDEVKTELFVLRFVNNPDCFAFQDENTGRVLSGVIDLEKFTSERLVKECYPLPVAVSHTEVNYRLVLESEGKEIKTEDYVGRVKFNIDKEVLVSDNGKLTKDILAIYVQDLKIGVLG